MAAMRAYHVANCGQGISLQLLPIAFFFVFVFFPLASPVHGMGKSEEATTRDNSVCDAAAVGGEKWAHANKTHVAAKETTSLAFSRACCSAT